MAEQKNSWEKDREIFSGHIADPSAISSDSTEVLGNLLNRFPYSQLLRSFYTRSLIDKDPVVFKRELARAALFSPDRSMLQIMIEEPARFAKVPEEQVTGDLPVQTVSGDAPAAEKTEEKEPAAEQTEEKEMAVVEEILEVNENTEGLIEEPAVNIGNEGGLAGESEVNIDEFEQEIEELETEDKHASSTEQNATIISHPAEEAQQKEQEVSRYDDDTLPYTFLWWLNKTRKEHSATYQPYVSFKLDTSQTIGRDSNDPLGNQIIENIFHLQPDVSLLENAPRTVPFQVKRKEDPILDRFIKDEPQIKAPNSDKLDTENKARKSSEDPNDLVSETLARIYTEQMLFHKALETYKKLSLKFPEKSTYFADQILDLEKKIN